MWETSVMAVMAVTEATRVLEVVSLMFMTSIAVTFTLRILVIRILLGMDDV